MMTPPRRDLRPGRCKNTVYHAIHTGRLNWGRCPRAMSRERLLSHELHGGLGFISFLAHLSARKSTSASFSCGIILVGEEVKTPNLKSRARPYDSQQEKVKRAST